MKDRNKPKAKEPELSIAQLDKIKVLKQVKAEMIKDKKTADNIYESRGYIGCITIIEYKIEEIKAGK